MNKREDKPTEIGIDSRVTLLQHMIVELATKIGNLEIENAQLSAQMKINQIEEAENGDRTSTN